LSQTHCPFSRTTIKPDYQRQYQTVACLASREMRQSNCSSRSRRKFCDIALKLPIFVCAAANLR